MSPHFDVCPVATAKEERSNLTVEADRGATLLTLPPASKPNQPPAREFTALLFLPRNAEP